MTPYYEDGAVTIYHGYCLEILPALFPRCTSYCLEMCDGHCEEPVAVVTDPPYGMAENTDRTRFSGGKSCPSGRPGRKWAAIIGDAAPFDPSPWLTFPEVILFGANHYASRLPVGTLLVWIKRYDHAYGTFLSDAEIAWQKGGHGVYCYREAPEATLQGREHPCEKPLGLISWCLRRVMAPLILDPFCGSGTTLRAAKDLGRRAIGIEIEERYCEVAARRCAQETLPFDAPVAQAMRAQDLPW